MYAYIDSFRKFGKTNTDNQSIKIKRPYPLYGSTPFFVFLRRVGFRPSCRGRCRYSYSNETASESEFVAMAFVTVYEEPSSAVTKNSRWQLSFFHDESSVMTNM